MRPSLTLLPCPSTYFICLITSPHTLHTLCTHSAQPLPYPPLAHFLTLSTTQPARSQVYNSEMVEKP